MKTSMIALALTGGMIIGQACALGQVFAGTQGGGTGHPGRVYRYAGGTDWIELTPPEGLGGAAAVMDLADFKGQLYAGVQTATGSGGGGGEGQVWRYEGGTVWTQVGTLDNSVMVLEVYQGHLYAATNSNNLYSCVTCDGTDWDNIPKGRSNTGFWAGYVSSVCGEPELFLGELNTDAFWRFNLVDGLVFLDDYGGSCIWDFADFAGDLYAGAWAGSGPVYRTEENLDCDHPRFVEIYSTGANNWALETFQGKLYIGSGGTSGPEGAKLWAYDGIDWNVVRTWPTTVENEGVSALVAQGDHYLYIGLGLPDGYYSGDGQAEVWRFDGDSFMQISEDDFFGGGVQTLLGGTDCNTNGIPDWCDVDCGPPDGPCDVPGCGQSEDCNSNHIPDECEPCGDNNGDGYTDLDDLTTLVSCLTGPGGSASSECLCMLDTDGDGDLDMKDFAFFQLCFNPGIGACCFDNGDCELLDSNGCKTAGGDYLGDMTNCTPNPCPQIGDNCDMPLVVADVFVDSNYTCGRTDDYNDTCLESYDGGEDIIYEWTVNSDACFKLTLDPHGTAYTGFAVDGMCPLEHGYVNCEAVQWGDGTGDPYSIEDLNLTAGVYYIMVDTNPAGEECIPSFELTVQICATGVCCQDGACSIMTELECEGVGGVYLGDDTGCDPNPCNIGACCFDDICSNGMIEEDCTADGGVYKGHLSTCDPNPCVGACCFDDGSCQLLTPGACETAEGIYWGDGTDCDPNPCPQPGDNCDNPLVVTFPADLDYTTNGDTQGMVDDYSDTCLGNYDSGPDIIYKLVVTGNVCVDITVTNMSTTYGGIALDNACPPGNPCMAYDAYGSELSLPNQCLTAGDYYLMIDTWSPNPDDMSFTITITETPVGACCLYDGGCVEDATEEACFDTLGGCRWLEGEPCTACPALPANDACANAEAIGEGTDYPFDTTCATNDGIGEYTTGANIWYCYTPTCTGTATISLCGSSYDTKLAIYADCGCAPLGTRLAENDDASGICSPQSQIELEVVASQQYLIEVGGYSDHAGEGVLTISCVPDPEGACCSIAGVCEVKTETECDIEGGVYLGDDTTCDGDPCAQGACCFEDGSCSLMDADGCAAAVGSIAFLGYGTTCIPNPCPQQGNDCTLSIVVTLPADLGKGYSDSNTTCGRGNDYEDTCLGSYDSGEDIIYKLVVTEDVCVDITVAAADVEARFGVAIDDVCPPGDLCMDYETWPWPNPAAVLKGLNLTVGTYYVMVDTYAYYDPCTAFDLTITPCPDGPPNDFCADAIDITATPYSDLGVDVPNATDDANVDPSCDTYSNSEANNGVWYTYTPSVGCDATITVSGLDTVTSLWTGADCDNLTQFGCEDDQTSVWNLTAGTKYWIVVSYFFSYEPTTQIDFSFDCVVPDGDCCLPNGDCQVLSAPDCALGRKGVREEKGKKRCQEEFLDIMSRFGKVWSWDNRESPTPRRRGGTEGGILHSALSPGINAGPSATRRNTKQSDRKWH
ncbi:MAG: hypothetical protein KAV82_04950 [Phycisphaerae bacterium]|nr:hypothetical protein [Phycisphaerae bacterium]